MFVYKKIYMYIYIVLYRYIDIFLGRGRIKSIYSYICKYSATTLIRSLKYSVPRRGTLLNNPRVSERSEGSLGIK